MNYLFIVRGEISPRRTAWFERLTLLPLPGHHTALAGPVADQPALHGILARIRDLGLPLAAVIELKEDGSHA